MTAVIRDDQGHALLALVPNQLPAPAPAPTGEDGPLLDIPTAPRLLRLIALPQDSKLVGAVDLLLHLLDIAMKGIQTGVIMTVVRFDVLIQAKDEEDIGTQRVGRLHLHLHLVTLALDVKIPEREAGVQVDEEIAHPMTIMIGIWLEDDDRLRLPDEGLIRLREVGDEDWILARFLVPRHPDMPDVGRFLMIVIAKLFKGVLTDVCDVCKA